MSKMRKEKALIIEENQKIKDDMQKQKNDIDKFKNEFNLKKEMLQQTFQEMSDIKKRSGIKLPLLTKLKFKL